MNAPEWVTLEGKLSHHPGDCVSQAVFLSAFLALLTQFSISVCTVQRLSYNLVNYRNRKKSCQEEVGRVILRICSESSWNFFLQPFSGPSLLGWVRAWRSSSTFRIISIPCCLLSVLRVAYVLGLTGAMSFYFCSTMGLPGGSDGKESACKAGDPGSTPGWGKCPHDGNGHPLQYSCLQKYMDRGAWWATVCGVTKSQTRLSN